MHKLMMLATVLMLASLGTAVGQSAEEIMAKADAAYAAFDNPTALSLYKQAWEADTTNCTVGWKLTRAYVDVGETKEKDEEKAHYLKAEEVGRSTVAQHPDSAWAHFYLSVAVGRLALYEGGKTKIRLSKEVKAEAEKALELDPTLDGAHHVLGRWHRNVANLSWLLRAFAKMIYGGVPPGASNEAAIEHFQKAIELKPDHINHYLELGKTYMETEQWAEAKAAFEKVIELPQTDADDPEHKAEAKELLKKVAKKM